MKTLSELFPEPLNPRCFLWAMGWEELEPGEDVWEHPGHDVDDNTTEFTTQNALKEAKSFAQCCHTIWVRKNSADDDLLPYLSQRYHELLLTYDEDYKAKSRTAALLEKSVSEGLVLPAVLTRFLNEPSVIEVAHAPSAPQLCLN